MTMKISIGEYTLRMTAYRQIAVGKPHVTQKGVETLSSAHYFNTMKAAVKYLETCLTLERDITTAEELLDAHKHAMFVIDTWIKDAELPDLGASKHGN